MPLMVCWEYLWFERGLLRIVVVCVRGLDECLGGKFVDVISDLKNSDVIVVVAVDCELARISI